jgi:hypothetical protein
MRVHLGAMSMLMVVALSAACSDESVDPSISVSEGPSSTPQEAPTAAPPAEAPAVDAGPAPAADLFALVATYETPLPTRTASQIHKDKGVNPEAPARASCLDSQCHAGNSASFAFGLTVCADAKCKAYASGVEVRVQGADGAVFATQTGADGNAWFADNGKLRLPARVALRKGERTRVMVGDLAPGTNAGSCNLQGCHGPEGGPVAPDGGRNVLLWLP